MPETVLHRLLEEHSHGEHIDVLAFGKALMAVERAACAAECRRVSAKFGDRSAQQAAEYCAVQIEARTI
ncbi:MAG: hypothetical protein KDH20_22345 [Rhodocyclaceae bacterium]|nr:hypothetical protein [Rhodocyclaceae bacterium]